jgi:hypothetical protein
MKECDQQTGLDMNPENTMKLKAEKDDQDGTTFNTGAIDHKGEHVKERRNRDHH